MGMQAKNTLILAGNTSDVTTGTIVEWAPGQFIFAEWYDGDPEQPGPCQPECRHMDLKEVYEMLVTWEHHGWYFHYTNLDQFGQHYAVELAAYGIDWQRPDVLRQQLGLPEH
jgi:hypothetical protein